MKVFVVKSLIRIKANLYTRTNTIEHHADHTDLPFEHKTALFYLNNNNGLTVLEDGTKVESVENRLLLFDGSKKHHSTSSTDSVRININFNYFSKKEQNKNTYTQKPLFYATNIMLDF